MHLRNYGFSALFFLLSLSLLNSCSESDEDIKPGSGNPSNPNSTSYKQAVGKSANDLLSADYYDKLIVEVQYVEGFEPTQAALQNLSDFLEARLHKPNGIIIQQQSIPSPGQSSYAINDLTKIEDDNRTAFTDGKTIAAYFFFADGNYAQDSENSKTLGIAYRNTSMVIFQKTITGLSNELFEPKRSLLESTVINHEFSHIMGLVNVGTPLESDHQDEAHGHHCDVKSCLMNYVAETGDVINNFFDSNNVPELDPQCINDLKANGGK